MRPRRIWIFDFDGTLSRLVTGRKYAVLDPACEEMLVELSNDSSQTVAVISSRGMDDLSERMPVHGLLLGGASGLEWRLPDGERIMRHASRLEELDRRRETVLPVVRELGQIPGVEIEDKRWSISVHYRQAAPTGRASIFERLHELCRGGELTLYRGPEVMEVHLLEDGDKASGVAWMASEQGWELKPAMTVYCGDAENDLGAMKWVTANGGIAIIVGGRINLGSAQRVANPPSLARTIRNLWKEQRVPIGVTGRVT
jgi:trehalose 6-phosphate phosphatase